MNRPGTGHALKAALLAMAISGCGGETGRGGADGAAAAADTIFQRGHVRVAGDSLFFTACGNAAEARLEDRTGGALMGAARALAGGGQDVYVEMNGGSAGAGTITAFEFLRASPVGEGGGCNRPVGDYLYHAFGEEPFWSVVVGEDSLVFAQPDEPSHLAWPAPSVVATRAADGSRQWSAAAAGGRTALTLTVERAPCTDSMSGEVTVFRARATLGGRALDGCARAGRAADEVR